MFASKVTDGFRPSSVRIFPGAARGDRTPRLPAPLRSHLPPSCLAMPSPAAEAVAVACSPPTRGTLRPFCTPRPFSCLLAKHLVDPPVNTDEPPRRLWPCRRHPMGQSGGLLGLAASKRRDAAWIEMCRCTGGPMAIKPGRVHASGCP
ncbi:hypothetical protein GQ53DRAFT_365872 [Thozetella sp. PMI_491]|nr:hypothetical protein GQ53DRAFT_365872 [Thozetella sp. PMI_491]